MTTSTNEETQKNCPQNATQKVRYHLLDLIRGITLISMLAYHLLWDLVYIFGVKIPWFKSDFAHVWQQSICYTFILLSGFCVRLGKHRLRRGLLVTGASIVISLATLLFMPSSRIIYGVLTLIGLCMLLSIPFDKIGKKINPYIGLFVCFAIFFLTRNVYYGELGFEDLHIATLPKELYADYFTALLGFPQKEFFSTDYFPIFPWAFLFFTGYFLYGIFEKHRLTKLLTPNLCPPLQFIGKHTLPIYMAHQPIIYGSLYLIFLLL